MSHSLIEFVNAISKKDESAVSIVSNDGIIVYHSNKNFKYRLSKDQELVGYNIKSLIHDPGELKAAHEIIQLSTNNKITMRFCCTFHWNSKNLKARLRVIPLNENHILVFTSLEDYRKNER